MQPVWRKLREEVEVPAKPQGVWTKVLDYVGPSRRLRIRAKGKWVWQSDAAEPVPSDQSPPSSPPASPPVSPPAGDIEHPHLPEGKRECGPDGDLDAPATAAFLTADALAGALIGKIGGSTGTIKGATIFLVGSESVIEVDDKTQGPLYLTINDIPAGMKDNSGSLKVTISDSL